MSEEEISATGSKSFTSWPGLKPETPPSSETTVPAAAPAAIPAPEELRFVLESRLVAEHPPQTSDSSSEDGLPPSRYEHGLWRAGWTDGRLGQTPDPQIQLVVSQGALTRSLRTAEATRNVAEAEAEERHKRYIVEQRSKEWRDLSQEYDRLVVDRRQNAVAYSRVMAFVYALFGLLIFLADMPLSLKVAPVLGVDVRQDLNGQVISADNLSQLFANFSALWEPFAVAVGIAALTIAFKILVDKLHKPYGIGARWLRGLAALMLFATVGAAVYAFVLIGGARAAHVGAAPEVDRALLFTILAVMFPVVAGYCFSMARAAWQNVAHYHDVKKNHETAWNAARDANLAAERAAAAVASANAELEAVRKDTVEEDFLKNLYLHGYQRGRCVPESSSQTASLYGRCESLLHHWLSQISQTSHEAAERGV